MAKSLSLTAALKDYFGYLPGQGLADFMKEIKALDDADRAYFIREFAVVGISVG